MARAHTGRHKVLATYRSYHGATAGDDGAHRRAAALGERAGDPRRRPLHGAVPVPVVVRRRHRRGGGRPGARPPRRGDPVRGTRADRRDHPRDGGGHQRRADPARRLPARGARALRRARHPADPRRGDGGLRPHRRVVRRRPLERGPRPALLRQGRELRLRAPRRGGHDRGHRGDLRRARLPGRAHLLRAPAGLRGGGRRHPRPWRTTSVIEHAAHIGTDVLGPGLRELGGAPRRRSARCAGSAASSRSSWCATPRPARGSCRSTRPATPPSRWSRS